METTSKPAIMSPFRRNWPLMTARGRLPPMIVPVSCRAGNGFTGTGAAVTEGIPAAVSSLSPLPAPLPGQRYRGVSALGPSEALFSRLSCRLDALEVDGRNFDQSRNRTAAFRLVEKRDFAVEKAEIPHRDKDGRKPDNNIKLRAFPAFHGYKSSPSRSGGFAFKGQQRQLNLAIPPGRFGTGNGDFFRY